VVAGGGRWWQVRLEIAYFCLDIVYVAVVVVVVGSDSGGSGGSGALVIDSTRTVVKYTVGGCMPSQHMIVEQTNTKICTQHRIHMGGYGWLIEFLFAVLMCKDPQKRTKRWQCRLCMNKTRWQSIGVKHVGNP
jgi:hypothetical protein